MKNKNKSLGLEADSRSHQTDEYWIRHFFNEQYKSLPEHLGFTASRATFLADLLLQSSLSDHQTVLYWANLYIKQHGEVRGGGGDTCCKSEP